MSTALLNKFPHYLRLTRIDKPIGTLLLLWPTLWALWFASNGWPEPYVLFAFVAGVFLMRSAGCVLNDLADRNFDGAVERTRERPLATGAVSITEALGVAIFLCLLAALLILPMPPLVWLMALIALWLAASYPYMKRFFPVPQAYLGIAFGFGIPMAFGAIQGQIPLSGWLLFGGNIFWTIAYDTEYGMVDRADDLKIGIHNAAITFGRFDVVAVSLCYAAALLLFCAAGIAAGRGLFWYAGLVLAAIIALYHYRLIRSRERSRCFRAFLHNNWLGATLFIALFLDTWL